MENERRIDAGINRMEQGMNRRIRAEWKQLLIGE